MKKIKLAFTIIWSIILILVAITAITFPSVLTIYLSKKVLPIYIVVIAGTLLITNILKELIDINKIIIKAKEKVTNYRGYFDWNPATPMQSNKAEKLIETYPKDYKFNFETFEIDNEKVQGGEAFRQSLIKFVNTPKYKYRIYEGTNYGTEHTLFTSENTEEFARQANNLAEQVIDYYGEWVEKIYRIKRENHNLIFELKVCGVPNTFLITIPDLEYYSKHKKEQK